MNNALSVFQYQEKEVRTAEFIYGEEDGGGKETVFIAKDVAEVLGYKWQSALVSRVPGNWKGVIPINTLKGKQSLIFLSEEGLYFFLSRSDKEKAIPFQKWIAGEVLPSIRKTGKYEALPTDPRKLMALALIEAQKVIDEKDEQLAIAKPKAEALDRIATADGSLCITNAAKDLQVRPKDLFNWLTGNKWIYRRMGGHWCGYQDKIQQGLLEHKVVTISQSDGTDRMTEQVRVTSKGIARISELLEKEAA